MITSHVVISQNSSCYEYKVNFVVAVHICRHFLRLRNDEQPPDIEALIRKNILPIRPSRKGLNTVRNIRPKSTVCFVYRIA